jgi:hypothetical protein
MASLLLSRLDRSVARRFGGAAMKPVCAILSIISGTRIWSLGWHQDRVIACKNSVRYQASTAGQKDGVLHV